MSRIALIGSSAFWHGKKYGTQPELTKNIRHGEERETAKNVVIEATKYIKEWPAMSWNFPLGELCPPADFRIYVSFKYDLDTLLRRGRSRLITHYYEVKEASDVTKLRHLKWGEAHREDDRSIKTKRMDTGVVFHHKSEFLTDGGLYALREPCQVTNIVDTDGQKLRGVGQNSSKSPSGVASDKFAYIDLDENQFLLD